MQSQEKPKIICQVELYRIEAALESLDTQQAHDGSDIETLENLLLYQKKITASIQTIQHCLNLTKNKLPHFLPNIFHNFAKAKSNQLLRALLKDHLEISKKLNALAQKTGDLPDRKPTSIKQNPITEIRHSL